MSTNAVLVKKKRQRTQKTFSVPFLSVCKEFLKLSLRTRAIPEGFSVSFDWFFLLLTPDLHDHLVGDELGGKDLHLRVLAVDGDILAPLHIPQCLRDNVLCLVKTDVIGDGIIRYGTVEKFGLDPEGADGHHSNASRAPLDVERP